MDDMTYTRCDLCNGTLEMVMTPASYDEVSGEIVYGDRTVSRCHCTRSPTPGWNPTGLTVRQLERMAERERVLSGDPGIPPDRRLKVLVDLRNRLGKAFDSMPVEPDPAADPAELYRELGEAGA